MSRLDSKNLTIYLDIYLNNWI